MFRSFEHKKKRKVSIVMNLDHTVAYGEKD